MFHPLAASPLPSPPLRPCPLGFLSSRYRERGGGGKPGWGGGETRVDRGKTGQGKFEAGEGLSVGRKLKIGGKARKVT
jgi:hypothetical protein